MKMRKREIAIELDQVHLSKALKKLAPVSCKTCHRETLFISAENVRLFAGIGQRRMFSLLDDKRLHFIKADGKLSICLISLLDIQ
jgi:hypothetical protein